MWEGPHSGAVAPKHRLVLETVLLLQCRLCISQDARVSMEMTAESRQLSGALRPATPHPPPGSLLGLFFLAFVSSPAVLLGAARCLLHAGVQV